MTTDTIASTTPPPAPTSPTATTLGQLADETTDVMTLHTQDAFRMFTGRAADAQTQTFAIPGGRRFAAVLKSIWYLSANDNPYADWILIRVYQMDLRTAANLRPPGMANTWLCTSAARPVNIRKASWVCSVMTSGVSSASWPSVVTVGDADAVNAMDAEDSVVDAIVSVVVMEISLVWMEDGRDGMRVGVIAADLRPGAASCRRAVG